MNNNITRNDARNIKLPKKKNVSLYTLTNHVLELLIK